MTLRLTIFAFVVVVVGGCDSGPKRVHVAGTVTFDGKLVPIGEMFFDPDVKKGKDGPQGFARIIDGKFDTRQGGKAPTAGPHVVRIQGFDGKAKPDQELIYGVRLFPEYSTAAEVPKEDGTLTFEVPGKKGK